MIDTLKLSKRLTDAHMPSEQAEALADALAEGLRESCVRREHFDTRLDTLDSVFDTKLAKLRTELVMWVVGTVGLGTLINHWWR